MDRIFNIKKPPGMTSHDVVYKVRKILGTKKVGHTGTLDPDAVGVLPICVGRATKVCDLILNKDKAYECELTLGVDTDTYDSSGEVVFEKDLSDLTDEQVVDALMSQVGDIDQYPPKYSALKVKGKKMCDLVRRGRADEIVLKPRPIKIKKIDIKSLDIPKILFEIDCSKGTYVRSVCHDVGQILGVGGHMSRLTRTRSGIFSLDDSISLEELEKFRDEGSLIDHSYSVEDVLADFPFLKIKDNASKYYSNGGMIEERRFIDGDYKKYIDTSTGAKTDIKVKQADKENFELDVRVYDRNGFIGIGKLSYHNDVLMIKSEKIFRL